MTLNEFNSFHKIDCWHLRVGVWKLSKCSGGGGLCVRSSPSRSSTKLFISSRDTQNRRLFTCSFLHLQWAPSLENRVNTSNNCHTLLEPQSRWVIDRRVETLNVNDNILILAVFPFSFDGNWSISEVFFFFLMTSFRSPLQKEWMRSRGWSSLSDHQRLSLRCCTFTAKWMH